MERDPVCHMDVDPETAAGKSGYKGKTYYFCSPGCKKSFDAEPEKYKAESGLSGDTGTHLIALPQAGGTGPSHRYIPAKS